MYRDSKILSSEFKGLLVKSDLDVERNLVGFPKIRPPVVTRFGRLESLSRQKRRLLPRLEGCSFLCVGWIIQEIAETRLNRKTRIKIAVGFKIRL